MQTWSSGCFAHSLALFVMEVGLQEVTSGFPRLQISLGAANGGGGFRYRATLGEKGLKQLLFTVFQEVALTGFVGQGWGQKREALSRLHV